MFVDVLDTYDDSDKKEKILNLVEKYTNEYGDNDISPKQNVYIGCFSTNVHSKYLWDTYAN